jgi:hypothetical protein
VKKIRLFFFFILPFAALAQSSGPGPALKSLWGSWRNDQFGYEMTMRLNTDGTGDFEGEEISYQLSGHILSIVLSGSTTEYKVSLSNDQLTLSGGDLDGAVTFSRSSAGQTQGAFGNTTSKLFGLWSDGKEMIDFRNDGHCVYAGETFPYRISKDQIVLVTSQGSVRMMYSLVGDRLTITMNGEPNTYNRVAGQASSSKRNGTGRQIPPELLGEWCSMNMQAQSQSSRCITLRADGTYLYKTESSRSVSTPDLFGATSNQGQDRGTWYVQDDRLHYQSATRGLGSFRLEKKNHPKNANDPMIVLDGEAFVTSISRSPWR